MDKVFVVFFLLVTVFCVEYTRSGINPLNADLLKDYLHENKTVIAMWSNKDCTSCDLELFSLYKMIFTLYDYEDVLIAATNTGSDSELDEKYNIQHSSKFAQYRLFFKGKDVPFLNNLNLPTAQWIQDVTGYHPRKESVLSINNHNYALLKTRYAKRNILYLFCKPSVPKCQKIIAGFLVAADVFRTTKNALFAYVDCSHYADLCNVHSISHYPTFHLNRAEKDFADEIPLFSSHGENIIGFMNEVCGTRYLSSGHYDENYGRVLELDILAHQFMMKEEEDYRKNIMKQVQKLSNSYGEASRYFNLMKKIMAEGSVAIIQELSFTKQQLHESKPGSKESKLYSARQNVAHQFENLVTWRTLVNANPWNFNYLLSKNHMIVLFTVKECELCSEASTVFNNLSKKGARGVTVASFNVDKYQDYAYNFHFTSFPVIHFYHKNDDLLKPIVYDGEISVYALYNFVDDVLDDFYSRDL